MDLSTIKQAFPGLVSWLDSHEGERSAYRSLVQHGFGFSLLRWLDRSAGESVFARLAADLDRVDWDWVVRLRGDVVASGAAGAEVPDLEPFPYSCVEDLDSAGLAAEGSREISEGRWGVVIFAGGAATRFWAGAADHPQAAAALARYGGNAPKGLFPLGSRTGRSFLDLFAGEMLESAVVHGRQAPLVLMAGRSTRDALAEWVRDSLPAGFDRSLVRVMVQAEHPRLDMDGNLLIRPDGSLVFTGDGHGGVFRALLAPDADGVSASGWLGGLGVRSIVLHNVDNVAARALEPVRLGYHSATGRLMTMSAVRRVDPLEKVGIVAMNRESGRVDVVEYSVCPRDLALARDSSGELLFVPAHINTNLVELDAIRPDLPPVLYPGKEVEVGGRLVPACSHEMLNQALAGLIEPSRVGVLVLPRSEFFQPTKSLSGADSLVTTREWLSSRGWE